MTNFKAIFAGISTMFLAIGIARFAFTPMLPVMQAEFGFSHTVSGSMASINFIGYLVGALAARMVSGKAIARPVFILSAFGCAVFTALMGTDLLGVWNLSRFATGALSGLMFVYASEIVMTHLMANDKGHLSGMMFSGIGAGMTFSGLLIPILAGVLNSAQLWVLLTAVGVVAAVFATGFMPKPVLAGGASNGNGSSQKTDSRLVLLYTAYLLSGAGYIITGTFLSVMVYEGTSSMTLSGYAWVLVGIGAVGVTPFWFMLAKRISVANALMLAFFAQTLSIAMPVILGGTFFTLLGGFCFGGSFLGVVSLTIAYGRELSPGKRTTANLTIYFGLGQIAGPFMGGYLSDQFGGFDMPVLAAAFAMLVGGILTYMTKR